MPNTLWRLRGSTEKILECCMAPTAATVHAVTVVFGSETFLNECYPDAASATRRGMQIRDGLLESGGWTVVGDAAVGLSLDDGNPPQCASDGGKYEPAYRRSNDENATTPSYGSSSTEPIRCSS